MVYLQTAIGGKCTLRGLRLARRVCLTLSLVAEAMELPPESKQRAVPLRSTSDPSHPIFLHRCHCLLPQASFTNVCDNLRLLVLFGTLLC